MNVKIIKIVAYYRVSTKKQGKSRASASKPRKKCRPSTCLGPRGDDHRRVRGSRDGQEVGPAEAARGNPPRRLTNSTLVVAKLDRLARNCLLHLNCLLHAELDVHVLRQPVCRPLRYPGARR